ncbi:hypothetical protein ACKX2L_06210 [Lachnospiraceae bacterium YH-ros2228]
MDSAWHLLKDKRPRNKQVVLGVDKTGYITRFTYDSATPPGFMDDHEEWFTMTDIVAWMPIFALRSLIPRFRFAKAQMPKYHQKVRKRELS